MKRFALLLAIAMLALFREAPVHAAGCEHIRNALAYNECLSKQAPGQAQRVQRGRTGASDPESTVPARGRAREARGVAMRQNGRRVRAVIDPWAGQRRATTRRR